MILCPPPYRMVLPLVTSVLTESDFQPGLAGIWIEGEIPTKGWFIKLAASVFLIAGLLILMLCVMHAVFFMLIMNEFGSLDEFCRWTELLGWKGTSPMRLLTIGLVSTIMGYMCYLFEVCEWRMFVILIVLCVVIFMSCHFIISSVMWNFYQAKYDVARGWRLADQTVHPDAEDPLLTQYQLWIEPFVVFIGGYLMFAWDVVCKKKKKTDPPAKKKLSKELSNRTKTAKSAKGDELTFAGNPIRESMEFSRKSEEDSTSARLGERASTSRAGATAVKKQSAVN